jgi:cobalt-zinc-cadmium efflux system membrane fusion protein
MTVARGALARVVVAAACALAAACGGASAPPQAESAASGAPGVIPVSDRDAEAAGITVAEARGVERSEPLRATGVVTFDERRTARVGARVEGVVSAVAVQPGERVASGARLASLHSHVVHDAWAAYFKALADRQRAETELTYARTAESRAAQLVADKALSPQELERARADAVAAAQAVAAVGAEVTRAEQELHHYGLTPRADADAHENDEVPVLSPLAGTVIERLTSPGATVTPGTPLFVVSDLSRVWVSAEIDEAFLGRLTTGSRVAFTTNAYGDESFAGTLTAVGDVIDPATRRVKLRVEADNAQRRLKPQMFVTLTLQSGVARRLVVVPSRAVQTLDGETVVFVRSGGTFVRRAVTAGAEIDGEVVIERGLAEGETVATAGAFLLKSELAAPATEAE